MAPRANWVRGASPDTIELPMAATFEEFKQCEQLESNYLF